MAIITKTLRSSGGNYSSISTWASTEQTNLVTDGDSHVLECYNDWGSGLDDELLLSGWTTDATHTITIKAASGSEHNGVPQAGFFINSTGATDVVELQTGNVILQDIEIVRSASGTDFRTALKLGSGANYLVQRCIIRNLNTTSSSFGLEVTCSDGNNVINNLVSALGDSAVIWDRRIDVNYYNNTIVGDFEGQSTDNNNAIFKNNAFVGNILTIGTTYDAADYNAFSGTGAFGTNQVTGLSTSDGVDFTGPSTGDYSVYDTGSVLYDAGADLSGTFTDDITGYTRVTWDIGAYEYQSAAAASAPPPHKSRRYMQLIQH